MTRLSRLLLPAVVLCLGMLASAERMAELATPQPVAGQIQVAANGLRIQPGTEANYLRFGDGVRITGQGFSLRADIVEIDIATAGVIDTSAIQLPTMEDPPERVIADPGSTVQQMAREIRGPSTNLDAASVQRIAASGSVSIEGPGLNLTTDTLFSTDGGVSWSTGGKAQLSMSDAKRGQQGSFSADLMSVNAKSQTLLARGNLSGSFQQRGEGELKLSAGELRADLKANSAEIRGGLRLNFGDIALRTAVQGEKAPVVKLNLNTMAVSLDGAFELSDSAQGLELSGDGLVGNLEGGQQVNVSRGFSLSDKQRGLRMRADKLNAVLDPLKLTVAGAVSLQYGRSSYESEQAVVSREGEGANAKYILEMTGPQTGRIDLDELRQPDGGK